MAQAFDFTSRSRFPPPGNQLFRADGFKANWPIPSYPGFPRFVLVNFKTAWMIASPPPPLPRKCSDGGALKAGSGV